MSPSEEVSSVESPVVSVLMPVYNAQRYVGSAIESILRQTFPSFEFIIIEDGSTDESLAICRRMASEDDRIRLVSRPNRGLIATLNEALELASGEYIARMDADDYSLPERFARQVDYLRANPECVVVGCGTLFVDPDGEPIRLWSCELTHEAIDAAHLRGEGGAIIHPAAMMRRAALTAIGGYRERFRAAEDLDLFLRLAEYGRVANLPEVLLRYRQHLDSVCFRDREWQRQSARRALREAFARRGLEVAAADEVGVPQLASVTDHVCKWAWWALSAGNVKTARKHAFAAVRRAPFSPGVWRLVLCAMRGY